MSVKISIIVPVYNVENYLEKCIKSILSQTYDDYELILLNDGSTDGSYDILTKYLDTPNVTIVNKPNTGQADTRYQGLVLAKGDYVYFVDSDDYIEPYTLEKLIHQANKTNADVVFGRYRLVDEQGNILREQKKYSVDSLEGTEEILCDAICVSNFKASLCLKLIKKSLLVAAYTDEIRKIHLNEDVCLSILLASHCNKVVFLDDVIYNVLQRATSITRNIKPEIITINDVIYCLVKKRLEELCVWKTLEKAYYNGYMKTVLYALTLVAVKVKAYPEYKRMYSLLSEKSIYYKIGLNKDISNLRMPYRFAYTMSKFPVMFYYINRMFKSLLKY